jgi:hypothetical protein
MFGFEDLIQGLPPPFFGEVKSDNLWLAGCYIKECLNGTCM